MPPFTRLEAGKVMTLNDFAYKSVTRQFWEKRLQLLDVNATHGLRKQEIAFARYLVI